MCYKQKETWDYGEKCIYKWHLYLYLINRDGQKDIDRDYHLLETILVVII